MRPPEAPTGGWRRAAREPLAALALFFAVLCAAYGNVIFGGRSLVYSDNYNPLDERVNAATHGPGFVPESAWSSRNLLPWANFHDPGATWWQWEPGGEFLRRAIERREWPWWDPYVGAGSPAMANLTQSFFFPPYLAMVALGDTPALKNAYFLAMLLVAAASSYAFLRRHGIAREAALGAGLAMLLCGGLNQNVGCFMGQTAVCLPVALWLTRYVLERPSWRRTALLALGYGVLALATFPPLLLAAFGISLAYALAFIFGRPRPDRGRLLVRYAVGAALGVGLVAFAYLPSLPIMGAKQIEQAYQGSGLIAVPWVAFGQLLSPVLMGGGKVLADAPMVDLAIGITLPYVGVVVLLLAGLAGPDGRRDQRLLFGVLAAGVVVVAAKLVGLEPVQSLGRLPALDHIHFAHYFGIPLSLLLALAAGIGLDRLQRGTVPRWQLALVAGGLGIVVMALPAVALLRGALKHPQAASWMRGWYLLVALLVLATALAWRLCRGVSASSSRLRKLCVAGLLLLVAAEGVHNNAYPRQRRWDVWRHPPPYVRQIVAHKQEGRVFSADALPANAGSALEVYELDSLMASNSERIYELYERYATSHAFLFLRQAERLPPEPVLDAANVALLAVREIHTALIAEAQGRGGYRQLFSDGYVRVLGRATEPRYYFTSSYRVTSAAQALAELPARARREVLLERIPGFPPHANDAGDPAVVARVQRNEVVLRLRAPRPGLVYCSETLTPGWRAEVNGRPAPILAANYAFRAVAVPAGDVVVKMSYFPPGLRSGLLMSLVAALATIALVVVRERTPVLTLEGGGVEGVRRTRRLRWALGAAAIVIVAGSLTQVVTKWPLAKARIAAPGVQQQPPTFYRVAWHGVLLPAALPAGTRVVLLASFSNAGTEVWSDPATADPAGHSPAGSVRLGYRWLDAQSGVASDYQSRTDLPHALHPGESATLAFEVVTPATPGSYRLQVDLVHELVAWFETKGAQRYEVPVEVRAARSL